MLKMVGKELEKIVKTVYGKNASFVKQLESYEDKNFLLSDKECCKLYVLKCITCNSKDIKEEVKEIIKILSTLSDKGVKVSYPYQALNSEYAAQTDFLGDNIIIVLLSFLQGQTLCDLLVTQEELNSACYQSGETVAEIDKELMKIETHNLQNGHSIWNMLNASNLVSLICGLQTSSIKASCNHVLSIFESEVLSCKSVMRQGLIHGDANDANIIVDFKQDSRSKLIVAGVIDFGDVMESKYVFEVGTLMAYVMIKTWKDKLNVHAAAKHALAGYESVLPLLPEERIVLFYTVAMRFVQILCIDSRSAKERPKNVEYIGQDLEACCALLPELLSLGKTGAWRVWT